MTPDSFTPEERKQANPSCPRCGIGTNIFHGSCIVCCGVHDGIASLIKELLLHKLRAEAGLTRERARREQGDELLREVILADTKAARKDKYDRIRAFLAARSQVNPQRSQP
jgi:hypothetical protein